MLFSTVYIILHNSISQAGWKKENKFFSYKVYTVMSGGRGAAQQTHNNIAYTHVFIHTNTFLHFKRK